MPLILFGLLLILGILAYSIAKYRSSGEEDDPRPVRERYPAAFSQKEPSETTADSGSNDGNEQDGQNEDDPIHAESYVDSDSLKGDIDYILRNLKEDLAEKAKEKGISIENISKKVTDTISRINDPMNGSSETSSDEEEDKTIIFPTDNVEEEKNKRNIH